MKIFLCALSDPLSAASIGRLKVMADSLKRLGVECDGLKTLDVFEPKRKAALWNEAVRSGRYSLIFDVSGGNLANLTLPYLDFEAYRNSGCLYAGFSDLTCVLNALYAKTGRPSLLYALGYTKDLSIVKGLLSCDSYPQEVSFFNPDGSLACGMKNARFAGGNLRCLLKLAGTEYFPDLDGKWLILEGLGTSENEFLSLMAQLKCMGVFERISGLAFGVFSRILAGMEMADYPLFLENSLRLLDIRVSWVYTFEIGHIEDERPVLLFGPKTGAQD